MYYEDWSFVCDMSCTYFSSFVICLFTLFKVVLAKQRFLIDPKNCGAVMLCDF